MEVSIYSNGQRVRVQAQIIDGNLWVHLNGHTRLIEPEVSSSRKRKSNTGQSHQVLAPMPGKVTKILVAKGQSVRKGDSLVVMEAMKMEYTLKSEIDTEVVELKCEWGQQVSLGQMLVLMKPAADGEVK